MTELEYTKEYFCKYCQKVKPIDEFYRDASKTDGIRPKCKVCIRPRTPCPLCNAPQIGHHLACENCVSGFGLDPKVYKLGRPCPNNHTYKDTKLTLRKGPHCVQCEDEKRTRCVSCSARIPNAQYQTHCIDCQKKLGIDTERYYLGKLCLNEHDYNDLGLSIHKITNRECLVCNRERSKNRDTDRDFEKYYLGKLCKEGHDFNGTGHSLRRKRKYDCVECLRLKQQARNRVRGPEYYERVSRPGILRRQYGLTPQCYDELLEKQNGRCAICETTPNGRRLAVDHCHDTGQVRGLLCGPCNQGIGLFKDNADLLSSAISYLTKSRD